MAQELDVAPAAHLYRPEPELVFDEGIDHESVIGQEDEPGDVLIAARMLVTPTAPRTWQEALEWCAGQSVHRSQDWQNLCQKFSRSAPGCPGGSATALDAFFNCPPAYRVVGGEPEDAEPGWQLVSRSRNEDSAMARFGHIFPTGRDFADDGKQSGWSTDALRLGWPDRINPRELYAQWNHEYLGRIRWQNGLVVDVKEPHVAPPENVRYERLADSLVDMERALRDLRAARDKAKVLKQWDDRDAIAKLIREQMALKKKTRDAYDSLRRPVG